VIQKHATLVSGRRLADVIKNSVTVASLLYFPLHLKHATTLPCETSAAVTFRLFSKSPDVHDTGVKMNGTHYCYVLLTKQQLLVICEISGGSEVSTVPRLSKTMLLHAEHARYLPSFNQTCGPK